MKAIIFNRIAESKDALSVIETKIPTCKEDEVLIRMLKSPINPADILFIEGKYRQKPIPNQIIGFEGVGIVENTNLSNESLKGKLVAFRHQNVWAEYVAVPLEKLALLPDDFSIDKASLFSLNPMTAQALIQESGVKNGDWLILTAGASSVSKLIVQLTKGLGIRIISIVRNSKDIEPLKLLGVDAVLTTDDNIKEIIPQLIGNGRLQAVIDSVGGSQTSDLIKLISPNGRLILYGLQSNDNVTFHNSDIIFKNLTISGFGIDSWLSRQSSDSIFKLKQNLISRIKNEGFIIPIDSQWNFNDFKKAFDRMESNNLKGKVLLTFDQQLL